MSLDVDLSAEDVAGGRATGGGDGGPYVAPRYRAEGAPFYHVLHGTVPGHQIDFMYLPEVPQGALRQTHLGHLARLIKYIEPRGSAAYAFALGNLSRDDVQHEPGHGGLAILFALRVPGVMDHAGRDTPPYAHAVIAADRHLDYATLLESTTVLYRRFLEREGAEDRRGDFYRSYVRTFRESPAEVPTFLARAIAEHDDLPAPGRSSLAWDYVVDDAELPRQIAIVYDEPMDFGTIAHWASTLGALLYRSNIKWTTVSTGREIDIAGGTSIRFVPRAEASAGVRGKSFLLDTLPDDDDALARVLFGAKRRGAQVAAPPKKGWREAIAAQRGSRSEPPPPDQRPAAEVDDAAATIPVASPLEGARDAVPPVPRDAAAPAVPAPPPSVPRAPLVPAPGLEGDPFSRPATGSAGARGRWIIAGAVLAALAVVVLVVVSVSLSQGDPSGGADPVPSQTVTGTSAAPLPSPPGSATVVPTAATAPSATVTATPTVTATATVMATPTEAPTATAAPTATVAPKPSSTGGKPGKKGTPKPKIGDPVF